MTIGARYQLKGKMVEVRKGQVTAHVRIDVNGPASVTDEAVDELGLAVGQAAWRF
jgi:molybdopterin-binding protein